MSHNPCITPLSLAISTVLMFGCTMDQSTDQAILAAAKRAVDSRPEPCYKVDPSTKPATLPAR